jgi:hypothetical protein
LPKTTHVTAVATIERQLRQQPRRPHVQSG